MLANLNPKTLHGTLIAVPIVNVFGFTQQSRYLPDRRDLNRSFPGTPRGSLAARLAHRSRCVTRGIADRLADLGVDGTRLFALGNELYERLGALAGHADDLRRSIERTVESFNRFTGSLESRVLVSARRFPGIDETKLDAAAAPAPIEKHPRTLTAPELTERLSADVGDLRERL